MRTRNDELANMDDEDWTEELVEEADANETRLHEIEAVIEARAVYRREDIAIAGCIATIGNDSELKLIQGLVRPEDMPARESNDANMAGQDDTGDGETRNPRKRIRRWRMRRWAIRRKTVAPIPLRRRHSSP